MSYSRSSAYQVYSHSKKSGKSDKRGKKHYKDSESDSDDNGYSRSRRSEDRESRDSDDSVLHARHKKYKGVDYDSVKGHKRGKKKRNRSSSSSGSDSPDDRQKQRYASESEDYDSEPRRDWEDDSRSRRSWKESDRTRSAIQPLIVDMSRRDDYRGSDRDSYRRGYDQDDFSRRDDRGGSDYRRNDYSSRGGDRNDYRRNEDSRGRGYFQGDSRRDARDTSYQQREGLLGQAPHTRSLFDNYVPQTSRGAGPVSLMDIGSRDRRRDDRQHERPRERFGMRNEVDRGSNNDRRRGGMDGGRDFGGDRDSSYKRRSDFNDDRGDKKRYKGRRNGDHDGDEKDPREREPILVTGGDHQCSFLLVPWCCPEITLHGKAAFRLLKGSVSVMGYDLPLDEWTPVFSPQSEGLLSLNCEVKPGKPPPKEEMISASEVKSMLQPHNLQNLTLRLRYLEDTTIAVLLIRRLDCVLTDFLTSMVPYTSLFHPGPPPPRDDGTRVKGATMHKIGLKVGPYKEFLPNTLLTSEDYDTVLDKWAAALGDAPKDSPPRVICCGGKNSGKSSFTRLLINRALKSGAKAVAHLELDVGQTEFTPPAILALTVVTKPLIEAAFLHQKKPERQVFFGDITPQTDPGFYLQCLSHVFAAYTGDMPLVVNTMGWTEGLGWLMLLDSIRMIKPTLIVQMETANQSHNLPALTRETLALEPGFKTNTQPITDAAAVVEASPDHTLALLASMVNSKRDFSIRLKPVDLRHLALLAHLGSRLERGLTLHALPPRSVAYRHLAVHVMHHRVRGREILSSLNAAVVALAVADLQGLQKEKEDLPYEFEETPVVDCLGLALVRGVDEARGLLYLVTPLAPATLRRVNTLLRGCLNLPDQLMLKQKCPPGVGPPMYTDSLAPAVASAGLRARGRMPRQSHAGRQPTNPD